MRERCPRGRAVRSCRGRVRGQIARGDRISESTATRRASSAAGASPWSRTATSSIVWASGLQDGSGHGRSASGSTSGGTPQGAEFQINTYTTGPQVQPDVAARHRRRLRRRVVAAWAGLATASTCSRERFDANGTRRGAEFQVNTFTDGRPGSSCYSAQRGVSWPPTARFVVVVDGYDGQPGRIAWEASTASATTPRAPGGRRVRRQHLDHRAVSSAPSVAVRDDGSFVVVWTSDAPGRTARVRLAVRRYDAAGARVGAEFQVLDRTAGQLAGRRCAHAAPATSPSPGRTTTRPIRTCFARRVRRRRRRRSARSSR